MNFTKKPPYGFLKLSRPDTSSERGTSVLEMALLIPVLAPLMLGIIEVGRYAELSIAVANAARAGVQYGVQNLADAGDTVGIQNAATYDAPAIPPSGVVSSLACYCSGAACTASPCSAPNTEVVYLMVTTTGTFTPLFRYPGLPSLTTVNSTAQMRVAQ